MSVTCVEVDSLFSRRTVVSFLYFFTAVSFLLSPLSLFFWQLRLQDGLDLLQERPDDPELLHAVGVGLAHRGISALDYEVPER